MGKVVAQPLHCLNALVGTLARGELRRRAQRVVTRNNLPLIGKLEALQQFVIQPPPGSTVVAHMRDTVQL